MPFTLGIDTSNYTTSAAVYNCDSGEVVQAKKLLEVKIGERGLRQSDALFQHTKQLPEIIGRACSSIEGEIVAVGVSSKPRSAPESYMPCFLAGVSAASAAAAVLKKQLHCFSHQQGHIAAALYSANKLELLKSDFLAFHISGGTTELIYVKPGKNGENLECTTVARTLDLNAGQLIDRVGVKLGLAFPAGAALEKLAVKGTLPIKPSVTLKDGNCCLSGIENKCDKLIADGAKPQDIALFTLDTVAQTIIKITEHAILKYGELPLVFAGGVMSDEIIKNTVSKRFSASFAEPQFSCDNAAGIAVLTAVSEQNKERLK